jgi:hypothetical protein
LLRVIKELGRGGDKALAKVGNASMRGVGTKMGTGYFVRSPRHKS